MVMLYDELEPWYCVHGFVLAEIIVGIFFVSVRKNAMLFGTILDSLQYSPNRCAFFLHHFVNKALIKCSMVLRNLFISLKLKQNETDTRLLSEIATVSSHSIERRRESLPVPMISTYANLCEKDTSNHFACNIMGYKRQIAILVCDDDGTLLKQQVLVEQLSTYLHILLRV